jgi:hypothetical protein
MTYIKGSLIDDADYNGFLTTVGNVYGVGTGDRGYGQTAIAQAAVASGVVVLASHWSNLTHMVTTCGRHQGTDTSALPPDTVLAKGQLVIAHSGFGNEFLTDLNGADESYGTSSANNSQYNIPNYVTAIDNNRFLTSSTALAITTNAWTVTRSTTWSNSINCEVTATWASEDAARSYFNSGGQVRLHGAHPTGSTIDKKWNAVLTGLGLVKLAMHATSSTGTPGAQNLGYYELTNNYQTIYNMTPGSGYSSYTNVTALIEAKRLNYAGVRGGNGNGVQFRITLSDTGPYVSTIVSAGTNFQFDNVRATTFLAGIPAPTYATVDAF